MISSFNRRNAAFTLIELLVVIGIIALLAGALGLGLRDDGNATTNLRAAQSTVASLLSSARGQAALKGGSAALFVSYDLANKRDDFLRYCVVATSTDNATWTAVNEGYYLPKGVYFVPRVAPTGTGVETGVSFGGIVSDGFDPNTLIKKVKTSDASTMWLVLAVNSLGQRFNISGTALSATGTKVVLSVANIQPPTATNTDPPMKYSNSQNVRGFTISQYGVAGFINDAAGFN